MDKITIGVDIENISKFVDLKEIEDKKFLQKIFTDLEISHCFQKIYPAQHLAARFAAKEAIMKAYNSITGNTLSLSDIEVKNEIDGKPTVCIKKDVNSNMDILLSISHNDDNAIAFAVIVKKNEVQKN